MDKGMIEEQVIDLLADICDDDAVREERDIDLFDACSIRWRASRCWSP